MSTKLTIGFITGLVALTAGSATAITISWVDVSGWPVGSLSQTGLTDSQGLTMDATFSNFANLQADRPGGATATIDDPAWPFSNTEVPRLGVIGERGSTVPLTGELVFSFTSSGGLPAGGSIGIFDLENLSSSVQLTGFQGGSEVDVNWAYAPYNVAGAVVPDADWNAATDTLTGAGGGIPGVNNFSFLVSDVQLDSVRLTINAATRDGVSFAVSGATVPTAAAVPDGGVTLGLLGLSLIGMAGANRFARRAKT